MISFTALQDFDCKELKSRYCRGLSYTVRDPNSRLAKLVPEWVSEGKVAYGDDALRAKARGKGEVI